jgi:hypothetical protein
VRVTLERFGHDQAIEVRVTLERFGHSAFRSGPKAG